MQFSRAPKHNNLSRVFMALSCLVITGSATGCYEQPVVERTTVGPEANAPEYEVDVYHISELAGRFIPQMTKGTLYGCFNETNTQISTQYNTINFEEHHIKYSAVSSSENPNQLGYLYIPVYKNLKDNTLNNFRNKVTVEKVSSIPSNINLENCKKVENKPQYLKLTYDLAMSGGDAIKKIWDSGFSTPKAANASIYVSSGDSYGISIPQSSIYYDIPTIEMLNAIGFTADTFGNHNFDNNLSYTKRILKKAEYKYVISNLKNLPLNLPQARPYTIVKIPPKTTEGMTPGEKYKPLSLAIIGLIDNEVASTVYPGRFGTLSANNDYCPVIRSMEEAYNRNARAFLLLGHMTFNGKGLTEFSKDLFELEDSPRDKKLRCESILFEDSPETRVEDIIRKRREIFNNILVLFGESNDFSTLTKIRPNTDFNDLQNLDSESDISNTSLYKDVFNLTVKSSQYMAPETDEEDEEPYIWYIQLPSNGTHTSKSKFTIKRTETGYRTKMTSFELQPVFTEAKEYSPSECRKVVARCKDYIDLFDKVEDEFFTPAIYKKEDETHKNSVSPSILLEKPYKDTCAAPKDSPSGIAQHWSCLYNEMNRFKNTSWQHNQYSPIKIYKFNRAISPEDSFNDMRTHTTFVGNLFTTSIMDYYNYNTKYNAYIKSLLTHNPDLRKQILNSVEIKLTDEEMELCAAADSPEEIYKDCKMPKSDVNYDIIYFNAGAFLGFSKETDTIDTEWVMACSPFKNYMTAITHKGDDTGQSSAMLIKDMLEHGINLSRDGKFPLVTGITFSFHAKWIDVTGTGDTTKKKEIKSVCEVWQNDEDGNLTDLLYYDFDCPLHLSTSTPQNGEYFKCFDGVEGPVSTPPSGNEPDVHVSEANLTDLKTVLELKKSNGQTLKNFVKVKGKENAYANTKDLRILAPDFISTGGDNYNNAIQANSVDIRKIDSTTSVEEVLTNYLSSINVQKNKIKKESKLSSIKDNFADEYYPRRLCLNNLFTIYEDDKNNNFQNRFINNAYCTELFNKHSTKCLYSDKQTLP